MSRSEEVELWSDEDVYYWVFDINIGGEHAVALWNAAVTGEMLLTLKKSQLLDHCQSLNKDTTNTLWREIHKLQKGSRKSIFRQKQKPSPVTPDYPDEDDDFDSDFDDDDNGDDPNAESLPERLKAGLREFQNSRKQSREQDNHTMEDYIVPDDDHNGEEEPQDAYEEFDHDGGQADNDELYLTPPDESNQGPELPPPLPSRQPLSPSSGDTNSHGAPVLPPRPGGKPSIPKYQPPAPSIPQFQPLPPAEDSEEEYVVPSSQVDRRQPMQPPEDSGELYEPPMDPSESNDFAEEYIVPDNVPKPNPPSGRGSPAAPPIHMRANPSMPIRPKPKLPVNSNPAGKAQNIGWRPPAPLPHDNNNSTRTKPSTGLSPADSTNTNSVVKKLAGIMGSNANSSGGSKLTGSQSFRDRMDRFQKPPVVAPGPKPQLPPSGGSLHQIRKDLEKPHRERRATTIPVFHEPQKPMPPEPVKPVMPVPRQNVNRNDLSCCDWFREDVSRETVTSALLNHRADGAFLVRPSDRRPDFPYTLQLLYRGKVKNLPIGKRLDGKFALGNPKDGETRFDSVRELIDYHRRHEVVLARDEGKTCLMEPVHLP